MLKKTGLLNFERQKVGAAEDVVDNVNQINFVLLAFLFLFSTLFFFTLLNWLDSGQFLQ
jgi:hypothetical protein